MISCVTWLHGRVVVLVHVCVLCTQGSAISDQLRDLAARRTDIFGSGAEETVIGKMIGEEEKKDTKSLKVGHTH